MAAAVAWLHPCACTRWAPCFTTHWQQEWHDCVAPLSSNLMDGEPPVPRALIRSYARGFAYFGALYSFNECVIEKYRAKHDRYNPIFAGCATGAMMAYGGERCG